jgi:methylglutaconyl-CoA hydratase
MSGYETIRLTQHPRGVARLVLARPERHNALNGTMIRELRAATIQLKDDHSIRVVLLCAEGASFCAGGDIPWMREQADASRAERLNAALALAHMLNELDRLPKPVVARVQGPAYGGGIGLMAVCDAVVASATARFALTEVRLGLIPAVIGPYVVRRLGEGLARRLILSGTSFDADQAQAMGLVSLAVGDELDHAVDAQINEFLNCAPGAVAEAKALCARLAGTPDTDTLRWTVECLANRWEAGEAAEGLRSFLAHEKPSWAPRS